MCFSHCIGYDIIIDNTYYLQEDWHESMRGYEQ